MTSNYFNVEVKPVMTPVAAGLHAAFADGDVLFDWTAFEIPRGPARLIGVAAEIRPKGNANADPNIFPFELLFAKSKDLVAPTTLGALNSAPAALTDIEGQVNRYIGHVPIVAADFGVTDQLAVASTSNDPSIVFQGEPNSGNTMGTDTLYVAGIAGGDLDFTSLTRINNGDLDGPTMTVNGTDPRLHIAKGDTVAVTTAADTSVTKAMGVVDSMTSNTIVLTEAFTTDDVVHTDFVYNTSPIKLILSFEK
jgi:hypothetical protein